ncbi:MAG: hypothetical protein ACRDT8_06775 [Micromonosporaceae bacterium]
MKKAAVVWLTVGDRRPCAAWCVWLDEALYVVSEPARSTAAAPEPAAGPATLGAAGSEAGNPRREQAVPGLDSAATATVTVRGDSGGRIVSWPARVSRVVPDSELWAQVAPQLASKRLNLPTDEDTPARWAARCVLSRLEPAGEPSEAGDTLPDSSHAAPPPGSPAARRARKPYRLHKVRRRGS